MHKYLIKKFVILTFSKRMLPIHMLVLIYYEISFFLSYIVNRKYNYGNSFKEKRYWQMWIFIYMKYLLYILMFVHVFIHFLLFLFFPSLYPNKKKNESNSTRLDQSRKEYWSGFGMQNLQWRGWFLSNASRDEIIIDLGSLIFFKFHPM